MYPTPPLHSVPPSSWPSLLGTGTAGMPSEANLSRLRSRLRQSGAIMSSRSVASRAEAPGDFEVVDVGEGRHATAIEQLLARLEQHGLRRRLIAEDDASAYAVDVSVCAAENNAIAARSKQKHRNEVSNLNRDEDNAIDDKGTSARDSGSSRSENAPNSSQSADTVSYDARSTSQHDDPDSREPYYYLCVPCELRLTQISERAPPWRALEDVHFHFSSAAHRSTASWMADDDIDETLRSTPLITPARHYSRIFVNGVPMLLSRRPGGGDMFYPLPHEVEAVRPAPAARGHGDMHHDCVTAARGASVNRGDGSEGGGSGGAEFQLFPSASARGEGGGQAVLWQRPLPSVYTGKVQLPHKAALEPTWSKKQFFKDGRVHHSYFTRRELARKQVQLDHVDIATYRAHTRLSPKLLPLSPAVLPVRRARVAKALLKLEARHSAREATVHGTREIDASVDGDNGSFLRSDDPHCTLHTQSYDPLVEGCDHVQLQGGGTYTTAPPAPLTVFEEESYRVALVSEEEQQRWKTRRTIGPPQAASHDTAAPAVVLTRELLTQHTQNTSQAWQTPGGSGVSTSVPSSMARVSRSHRRSNSSAVVRDSPPRRSPPPSEASSGSEF